MKSFIHFIIFIVFAFFLGGCDQKTETEFSGKPIKIGVIAPFSGSGYAKGQEGLKGMITAKQVLPSLKNGDRIEWVTEDDQNDPAMTVSLLKKLVEKDKVAAIITFSSSDPVLALAKIADKYQTPILAALATHPSVTEGNRFISQLCFDDDFQGTVAALFVRDELLIDKVATFRIQDNSYSRYLADKFESKFKAIGGEITDRIFLNKEAVDLSETIQKVHAKNPELFYLPLSPEDVFRIIREVQKLNWEPKMMGTDGLISNMVTSYKDELVLADGMLATDVFAHGMPLTSFGKKLAEIDGGRRTHFAGLGAEAYALLLNAMNQCNDPQNHKCINHKIHSTNNFTGIVGKITIGPDGKAHRPLCIDSIQNGLSKFIVKVY